MPRPQSVLAIPDRQARSTRGRKPTRYDSPEPENRQPMENRPRRSKQTRDETPEPERNNSRGRHSSEDPNRQRSRSRHSTSRNDVLLESRQRSRSPSTRSRYSNRDHSPQRSRSRSQSAVSPDNSLLWRQMQEMQDSMMAMQQTLQHFTQSTPQRQQEIPRDRPTPTATYTPTSYQTHLHQPQIAPLQTPIEHQHGPPTTGNHDLLQALMPKARPSITVGIDITAHVLPPMREKIWRDEYVQLSQLLPQQSAQYGEEVTLALSQETNNNLALKITKPKAANLTLQQWEDSFLVYMAVYTQKYNVCTAMCTYMRDVKDLGRRGANFLFYDEQFRLERQTTHCNWDSVHTGLMFQATTPFRFNTNKHEAKPKPVPYKVPKGYCNAYHTRHTVCKTSNCSFRHECPVCEDRHPIYRCPKPRNGYKRTTDAKAEQTQQPKKTKDGNSGSTK